MAENRQERLLRAGLKSGMTEQQAAIFAQAVAKELDREKAVTDSEFSKLRGEMERLELRLKLWLVGALATAVGALATIIKLF